jgi:hypothetical protein
MFISTAGWALPIQILAYYILKINVLEMMCFGFPVMCTLVFSVFGRVGMREKETREGGRCCFPFYFESEFFKQNIFRNGLSKL